MATPLFHLHPWRPCCSRSQVSSPTTRTGTGASSRPGCQALLVACVKGFNLVPPVFYQGRARCHRHVADPHLTLQRFAKRRARTPSRGEVLSFSRVLTAREITRECSGVCIRVATTGFSMVNDSASLQFIYVVSSTTNIN